MKSVDYIFCLMFLVPTVALIYLLLQQREHEQPIVINQVQQPPPRPLMGPIRTRQPEFRQPPYRNYKPKRFQQVGLITSATETLPLYGKASEIYNNRWNYYTSTPGQQIYSLPVTVNNRDCTEDIGCEELYDNQSVSVYSKPGVTFNSKIYRIDQHPYSLDF
ncbi:hypothetical protein N9C10_01545 [Flavobacteriaceae bacterium]|nr:hypothetical protein [Flavobacteriaceae bacterium]